MNRMTTWEKTFEYLAIILIICSIVIKSLLGVDDVGILVTLSFVAILIYVIFLVSAFFPAYWRMTEKQKEKIKDMSIYQAKYRKIFVVINFLLSIVSSGFIMFVC